MRTAGGGTAKAAPKAAASATRPPAQSRFAQSEAAAAGRTGREGEKEPLPGSAATGPRPKVPLPT